MIRALPSLRATVGLALLVVLLSPTQSDAQVPAGWSVVELPGLTEYHLYRPAGVDPATPSPLIVFLHGSGSSPAAYYAFLQNGADAVGAILALPKSTTPQGWGVGQDQALVEATLSSVESKISVDLSRISVAGHSAGATFGYLLAYATELPFSSVFTLAASYQPLAGIAGTYVPPIRMAWGSNDTLFQTARPQLENQWQTLGVDYEVEEIEGGSHSSLPPSTILSGFAFLVSNSRTGGASTCVTSDSQLCLINGRFKVTVSYTTTESGAGIGHVADMKSDGSGLFWFFDPLNWEMLVKVLDGCFFNEKFWVLVAASTDISYTVTVTDLATGQIKTYQNQEGTAAPAVVDLDAFSTCTG